MASATGDRNLLFGILALQMDFIPRDALVKALNAWRLDKRKGLDQILVAQGAMSAARCALLEPLVEEHVKQHGGDPAKSLEAVSALGSAREELKQIADPDVQASLANVPAADPYATDPPSAGAPSAVGRRFRILRPHAKGGLGEVFVARDEELHREVALKEIQERHADHPESRARFLVEAEITGGLEHPGIVPVYGLGTYADGRPFYAMRFIKGDSLKEAIERFHKTEARRRPAGERALELRKLLGRFVDVCDAIGYAHSRGVLHRDLKPGNVMLGKYGETLVVDWGLAKPMGAKEAKETEEPALQPSSASGSAETLPGKAIGTPAYMSPEQAAGRLDQMGTASDVYGLGATLYTLLTGKSPFSDPDIGAVLRKVERGEFPRPRQVNRNMCPSLEAICMKAMALKPADRYVSAQALAEDVEHWLAHEPVSVYRERWTERVVRWARRRPGAARFLGLFIVALLAGTGISTYFAVTSNANYVDARRREKDANDQKQKVNEVNGQLGKTNAQLEETLARSLLRPLGHQADKITDPEIEALWELASLPREQEHVRLLFVEHALQRPMTSRQFRNRADLAVHAAVGLDPARRHEVEGLLLSRLHDGESDFGLRTDCVFVGVALDDWGPEFTSAAARQAVQAMAEAENRGESDALKALAEAVAALAPWLEPGDASAAAHQAVDAMKATDPNTVEALAEAVAALASRLEPRDASAVAQQAIKAMEGTNYRFNFERLAYTVAALTPRLERDDAARLASAAARQVLEVMARTDNNPDALNALADAVAGLAPWLKPGDVSAVARQAVKAMGETHDPYVLTWLAYTVAALASRLEPDETIRLASAAAHHAVDAMETTNKAKTNKPYFLVALASAVTALEPWLEPGARAGLASAAAHQAVDAMAITKDPEALKELADAMAALAPWLERGESTHRFTGSSSETGSGLEPGLERGEAIQLASAAAHQVVEAMGKTNDPDALKVLASAVAALAPWLQPGDVLAAARLAMQAMETRNDSYALNGRARAVAALAPRLERGEAARLISAAASQIVEAMGKTNDRFNIERLAYTDTIAALAPWLEPGDASAASQALEAIGRTNDYQTLEALSRASQALAPRLERGEATRLASAVTRWAVEAMTEVKYEDQQLKELAVSVVALAPWLEPADASAAARQVVAAMGKAHDRFTLKALAEALAALTVQPEPGEVSRRISCLALAVGNSQLSQAPMTGLVPLLQACRPLPGRFTEQQLVDLLKMPTCQQLARQVIVHQLGWQCGQTFANQWEFVEWARQHRPDLDLTSPPTRP